MPDTSNLRKPAFKQDELRSMPAEARMRALEELKEELKKRDEEAKRQQAELREAVALHQKEVEELDELEQKGKEEIDTLEKLLPKQKEVKIEDLFKSETEKADEPLEKKLDGTGKRAFTAEEEEKYIAELAKKPMQELYQRFKEADDKAKNAYESTSENAYQSQSEEERRHLMYAIREKENATLSGKYTASQEILAQMGAFENRVKQSYNQ